MWCAWGWISGSVASSSQPGGNPASPLQDCTSSKRAQLRQLQGHAPQEIAATADQLELGCRLWIRLRAKSLLGAEVGVDWLRMTDASCFPQTTSFLQTTQILCRLSLRMLLHIIAPLCRIDDLGYKSNCSYPARELYSNKTQNSLHAQRLRLAAQALLCMRGAGLFCTLSMY